MSLKVYADNVGFSSMDRFRNSQSIARPTGLCAITGENLLPNTQAIAVLCEREGDEHFDRFDYSLLAWEEKGPPERIFSHWKYVVPDKNVKTGIIIDDEVLLDLFERLSNDERPQRIAFRYILALVLIRKRKLQLLNREKDEKGEKWLLRFRGTDADTIEVRNPGIAESEIQNLSDQLSEILQGDL